MPVGFKKRMFKKIFSIFLILIILSNAVIGIKTMGVVLSPHNSPVVRKPIYSVMKILDQIF